MHILCISTGVCGVQYSMLVEYNVKENGSTVVVARSFPAVGVQHAGRSKFAAVSWRRNRFFFVWLFRFLGC